MKLALHFSIQSPGHIISTNFYRLDICVRICTANRQELELEQEAAASSLGASRWQVFTIITVASYTQV